MATNKDFKVKNGLQLGTSITAVNGVAPTNGQLLIGNTANGDFDVATLTAGSNITITNAAGGITIASSAGGGFTAGGTLDYPNIAGAYSLQTVTANSGTTYTINTANGSIQLITLTGNCTFTFPTPAVGKPFTLMLLQDSTGSRTVSWPSAVRWPGGTAPTLSTAASRLDKFNFISDGTYWLGFAEGATYNLTTSTPYRYLRFVVLANGSGSYAEIPELRYLVGATAYPTVNMTNNTSPSPLVASASSYYTGVGDAANAWSAFDNNVTRGSPSYGWTSSGGAAGEWLQIDFGSGNTIAPTGLRITPWSDGAQASRHPTSFRVDGSNTGSFTGEQATIYTGSTTWPGTSAAQTFTF